MQTCGSLSESINISGGLGLSQLSCIHSRYTSSQYIFIYNNFQKGISCD